MTPDVVGNLDFWAQALCTFPAATCDLARLLRCYRAALELL